MAPNTPSDRTMPIAIVGIGCRLPGGANSPSKLWDLLAQRKSARASTPLSRFNIDAFYHPSGSRNGSINVREGYFLDQDISAFDAPFFSISPAEAISMDPMQRILLEVAYEAAENAGIQIEKLAGSDAGCFVGCFTQDYDEMAKRDAEVLPKYHSIGTGKSILSNRISFCLDLKGPSMTLDTACSSSLVALHLACQALKDGECSSAIVGATNLILSPDLMVGMTNLGFLSPDGISYAFDSRANGYARGEGVAALVLKPLEDAIRDGDVIRSVIRGTAVNSNGRGPGITLPSQEAQMALMRAAYRQAGLEKEMAVTRYVEAHGTGTSAGDPIEARAVGGVLGRVEGRKEKLFIGSIKANLGHLEGASGLAGLIKAILCVEAGVILPNIQFEKGNPTIDFDGLNIRVPTELVEWPSSGVRRASVNGFGYGGTNSHVIIDDAYHYLSSRGLKGNHKTRIPSNAETASITNGDIDDTHSGPWLFPLSASDPKALSQIADSLARFIEFSAAQNRDDGSSFLNDLSFTLNNRRSRLEYRHGIVAATDKELIAKLDAVGQATPSRYIKGGAPPKIAFIFTGQGAQWWGMGRELVSHPTFRKTLDRCAKAVRELGSSWDLVSELLKDEVGSEVNRAPISQPLCTAVQIALVDFLASWEVHPWRVAGHSSGEIAAAYAIGALSLEESMKVAYFRGLLAPKTRERGYKGGMLAVGLSEGETLDEIQALGSQVVGKIGVACVNSPRSTTVSGDVNAIMELQTSLTARGVFARKLAVDTAYHSHHMLAIADEYKTHISDCGTSSRHIKSEMFFSSVHGRKLVPGEHLGADYWVQNMVSPVRFSDAVAALCMDQDTQDDGSEHRNVLLVELGPHSALAGPIKQILASILPSSSASAFTVKYQSALVRGKNAASTAYELAVSFFEQGNPLALYPSSSKQNFLTALPPYSWNHTRTYWSESRISRDYRLRSAPRTEILGAPTSDWNPLEPRWRGFIRLAEQPWVADHIIQGAILYPAAGFCCMALQAASQLAQQRGTPMKEYRIRELNISRALVIPQDDDPTGGVEVLFCLRPSPTSSAASSDLWNEFRIFSYNAAGGGVWTEHCRGLVLVGVVPGQEQNNAHLIDLDEGRVTIAQEAQRTCRDSVDVEQLYSGLDAIGLCYGASFRSIKSLLAGPDSNHVMGTLEVTDTKSMMPKGHEFGCLVHPTTMDAMLQMGIVALSRGDVGQLKQAYVPTSIEEITVSGHIDASAGRRFSAAAKARPHGFRDVVVGVAVLDQDSFAPVIRMEGVKCRAITSSPTMDQGKQQQSHYNHVGRVLWEPEVDLLEQEQLNKILRKPLGDEAQQKTRIRDLEFLAYSFMRAALDEITPLGKAGMQDHHVRFLEYMQTQDALVRAGQHEQQTPEWTRLGDADVQNRLARLKESLSSPEDYEGQMILRMGQALPSVLRQQTDPLSLMMDNGLLHDYYRVALGVKQSYPQVAEYIKILSHKNPNLEYLEIGAGTGGCTAPVLDALSGCDTYKYPRMKSYLYTDISAGFFDKAEAWLRPDWGHLVEFKKLNIEEEPLSQGFGQVDVIIAANVLHATKDISRTLAHTRKLLRPGGKLVVLDMAHQLLSVSLIFGNLPGWWLSEEDWRRQSPLLSEDQWRQKLAETGFSELQASSPDFLNPLEEGTRVLIATALEDEPPVTNGHTNGHINGHTNGTINGDDSHKTANGISSALNSPSRRSIVILRPQEPTSSEKAAIQALKTRLMDIGVQTKLLSPRDLTTSGQALEAGTAIISFMEVERPWLQDISESDFAQLKHLTQTASGGIIWVTRGGLGTRPDLSLIHGLARSLRAEDESRRFVTVDLHDGQDWDHATSAAVLTKLYTQTLVSKQRPSDSEFVERDGMIWVKRVIQDQEKNQRVAERTQKTPPLPELWDIVGRRAQQQMPQTLSLQARTIGTIDSLVFTENDNKSTGTDLAPGHVEIQVKAVGLNFRDVLITLGEVADNYLGNECSGVVTRIHPETSTNLALGDRVAAWCLGSFATSVQCPATCVQPIPDDMSFPVAASLPLAYVTAYHALVNVARLQPGESVLVHAGAGGVGQAAIQVARMICGPEGAIYATVGSDEKKEFLVQTYGIAKGRIFNSRDLSFVRDVERATGGKGVDVVVNSLGGDALRETWTKVMAPFGRFIELGKRDIDVNGKLDMSPLARNTMYAAVDVTHLWRERQALAGEILQQVMTQVRKGALGPVAPILVEPFSRVQEAFRLMQSGRHMGKIVLEFKENDLCMVVPRSLEPVSFPPNATYLLAGGLGGLGRSISRWMVQRGARNFIYVSRSGTSSSPAAQQLIAELNGAGVQTVVLRCDVTKTKELSTALGAALKTLPPLRGVIQGAMVLNDGIFANMAHSSYTSTIRPKVQGSWALHHATVEHQAPLDFFIMLSSAAAIVGNAGQANYVAGCTYQGALAKYRRQHLGLPGTAIDVGKITGVGFVAERSGTVSDANLTRLGMPDISEAELLAMLELAMVNGSSTAHDQDQHHMVTGVLDLIKNTEAPFWARDPVFSHLHYTRPQSLQQHHQEEEQGNLVGGSKGANQDNGPTITQVFAKLGQQDKEVVADEDTVLQQVLKVLAQRLARALMIPADEVDTIKSPANLGADSLVAIEIRNWLAREAGIEMPVFDILQAPSLAALAGNMLKLGKAKLGLS